MKHPHSHERGFVYTFINHSFFKGFEGIHRELLTKLCRCAYESLLEFLRTTIGLTDGVPGVVMSIHTFGDYMQKFHPPLHALVSEGLFRKSGIFYVMPKADHGPLEEIFRANVRCSKPRGKSMMCLSVTF